ncbi:hypothetical protein KORDIASMS9_03924 [Kordia sp. SMS9]|uniref:hypothetical protein n=1 Tax=Kordia sp. SMS9 TaxID=2282170 RepID=UPI000E0CDE10|nr:hypothetical protein [Kordia sp. SMS9]AXG71667.1 hypothetical protein KORDIASMS9_03924 [Kordia sp. SMS9]
MKKGLGFILLSIGGFIAITLFTQIPSTIEKLKDTSKIEAEEPQSFIIGVVIAGILLLIIAMTSLYFGFQMLKRASADSKVRKKEETSQK